MTNKQAYKSALRPYALPGDSIELMLMQHGFDTEGEYARGNEHEFYSAVIDGLMMLITLEAEKDAGSENRYDTDKLMARIRFLRKQWDIEDPEEASSAFVNLTNYR